MVDGIGKGGPRLPLAGPVGPSKPGEASRPFEVHADKPQASAAQAANAVAAPTPLEQLRSGAIDLDGYVDAKVGEATAHLHGLDPVKLADLRAMLREQVAGDPTLADLFQQATGRAPPAPSDE